MSKKSTKVDNKYGIGIFIFVGILIILVAIYALSKSGTTNTALPANEAAVHRISLVDAKTAFDDQTALFVDVRDPASFAAQHIPNAINVPLADIESGNTNLDPNQWIITYCT